MCSYVIWSRRKSSVSWRARLRLGSQPSSSITVKCKERCGQRVGVDNHNCDEQEAGMMVVDCHGLKVFLTTCDLPKETSPSFVSYGDMSSAW